MADARFCRNCGVAVESAQPSPMTSPRGSQMAESHGSKTAMKSGVSRELSAMSEVMSESEIPSWVDGDGWPARNYGAGRADPLERTENALRTDSVGLTNGISPERSLVSPQRSLTELQVAARAQIDQVADRLELARKHSPVSQETSLESPRSTAWDGSPPYGDRISATPHSSRVSEASSSGLVSPPHSGRALATSNSGRASAQQSLADARAAAREALRKR